MSHLSHDSGAGALATAAAHAAAAEESGHDARAPKFRVAAFGSSTPSATPNSTLRSKPNWHHYVNATDQPTWVVNN